MLLNNEKFLNILPCQKSHDQQIGISFICLYPDCNSDGDQFICNQCLKNNHINHIEFCIHLDDVEQILDYSITNLRKIIEIHQPSQQKYYQMIFNKFFTKKCLQLIRTKKEIKNNIQSILNYSNELTFAFNTFIFIKQFITNFNEIIDKQSMISKIEQFFNEDQNLYQQGILMKAKLFISLKHYDEAIICCEKFLEINLDSQAFMLKGYCLQMLDKIDEAEEIYEILLGQEQQHSELMANIVLLIESSKNCKFKNYQLNFEQTRKDIIDSLVGKMMVIDQKYEQAIKLFDYCIEQNPNNYLAFTFRGYCFFYLDQHKEANTMCQKALEIYPQYYAAIILKYKLFKNENQDLAILQLIKNKFNSYDVVKITNDIYFYCENELENEKLCNKQFNKQEQILINRATELESEQDENVYLGDQNLNLILKKGIKFFTQLIWDSALQMFEEGIQLDLSNEQFWKYKIITQYMKQELKEVEESIETYSAINPKSKELRILKNQFKWFKQVSKEKRIYELMLPIPEKKEYVDQLYQKGLTIILDGYYQQAISVYQKVYELDPTYIEAKLKVIYCQIFLNQIDQAKLSIEQVLQTEKKCIQALQLKGIIQYYDKNYDGALKTFQQVEKRDKNFVFVKFYQGHCYYKLKQFRKAKEIYYVLMRNTTSASLQRKSYTIRYFKTVYALRFEDENFRQDLQREYSIFAEDYEAIENKTNMSIVLWSCLIQKDCLPIDLKFCLRQKKLIDCNTFTKMFYLIIGDFSIKAQRLEDALTFYEELLKLYPNCELGYAGKSYVLSKMDIYQEAEEAKKKALEINPQVFSPQYQNEFMLQEMELLETKMFIPELYSLQQEVFHCINLFF